LNCQGGADNRQATMAIRRYLVWQTFCAHRAAPLLFLVGMTFAASVARAAPEEKDDPETAVCGAIREPFMFWLWRSMAGSPDPKRVAHIRDLEPIRFKARDSIELGGYKLAAIQPRGYLLVALGNAMLADQLVADLQAFRDLGLDVYIFDYRGYGISKGKSRLAGIAGDYAEIVSYLNDRGYAKRLLYGISMGGVILLNAVGRSQNYTRLVVDSSPSRISDFGCPERYDPVEHLSQDSSKVMIVSGAKDQVVPPWQMDELIRVAKSQRGHVLQDPEFAHPYQDSNPATHRRRQNEVAKFLLQD
jgi:alpha/beta superfamily hydrolase